MGFNLRNACPHDLDAIRRLWWELTDWHLSLQPQRPFRPDAWEHRRRDFERALGLPSTNRVFLAEQADGVVGVLWCEIRDAEPGPRLQPAQHAEIEVLVVSKSAREQGVGECLMRACQEWLEGNGITRTTLKAVAENEDARRFYERLGFRAVTVVMEKSG